MYTSIDAEAEASPFPKKHTNATYEENDDKY
jgi:hypothetical protein